MSTEKKPNKNSKLIVIIIAVMLGFILVSGAVFGGYYFASRNSATTTSNGDVSSNKKEASGEELTLELDEFLINLADEGKPRYLKVKVAIGYNDGNENLKKELEVKKPVVRDTLNNVFRTKKTADLKPEGEEVLKKELLDKVNDALSFGKIHSIYFSEILVQ